jgi:ubiquinone/menaquinone biosynthesis C-methylase UbiE
VENLPFAENSIDFIVSSFSLHHWTDPEKVFKELYRILKQEGVLLIFDFRRDSRRFYYGLFAFVTNIVVPKALKKIKEPSGSLNAGYTAREMKEILSKAKIGNVEVKPFLAWMFIHIKKK